MINYGPLPPLPGASQRGEWGGGVGEEKGSKAPNFLMGLQSQWRHYFFSFLALFCLKQEKPDLFLNHHAAFFSFFFFKESSKMWIDIVIFFSFSSVRWRVRSVDPPASVSAEPQPFLLFFFFLFTFFVADVTPRRRSGKHLFRWNQTQETRNVSAVAFLPNTPSPNPSPIPPSQQGATFFLQQELGHFLRASERADLFVQDPPVMWTLDRVGFDKNYTKNI